jgi:putative transposase
MALSNGKLIESHDAGRKAQRALTRQQRKLARKKRGSNNRRKQVRRIARLHARIARIRKDFVHKATTDIAKNHGLVVLEKLEVQNMVRSAKGTREQPGRNVRAKAGLNRSILDQGWGMARTFLGYKLPERGGLVAEVPPHNSSRECFACGLVDAANRNGSRFLCVGCGNQDHADLNAAKVIKKRAGGTGLLPVEGHRAKRPGEAGTGLEMAA